MSKRVAMMGSGSCTTIGACLRGITFGQVSGVEIGCVIVSNEKAEANALGYGIPPERVFLIQPKVFSGDKEQFGSAIIHVFQKAQVDFYAQLGWVPYTPDNVIDEYPGFNQHPAPVDPGYPDFGGPGMNNRAPHLARLLFCRMVRERDPARDIMWTEMTTQFVDKVADMGDIILTERVSIEEKDDPISMQERMKPIEQALVMRTMEVFAAGTAVPYKRPDRLVLPQDMEDWKLAKKMAIMAFPKG